MRLEVEQEQTLWTPDGSGQLRTGLVAGDAFAATAPTVELGLRRANRVAKARFAKVADWQPLEVYSNQLTARRSLGRHVRGRCRVTEVILSQARVLVVTSDEDLAVWGSNWEMFEDLDEPDSRNIAEFVRDTPRLDGLVTRALSNPQELHVALFQHPFEMALMVGTALCPTLPDPRTAYGR